MKKFKRFIALVLTLSMVVGLTSVPGAAMRITENYNRDNLLVYEDYPEDIADLAVYPDEDSVVVYPEFVEQVLPEVPVSFEAVPLSGGANLIPNGDFSSVVLDAYPYYVSLWYAGAGFGWRPYYGGFVRPNSGLDGENTSANMVELSGWNGVLSDVITLTAGRYRLSAWVRSDGSTDARLFLTGPSGTGRQDLDRYWLWDGDAPHGWALYDPTYRDLLLTTAIFPSVLHFTDATNWEYRSVEFNLDDTLIELFNGGQVRAAFRNWGSGNLNITGISLVRVGDAGPVVNKLALGAAITAAQGRVQANYTEASWTILAGALSNAQTVYADVDATQTAVDTAANALQAAINGLVATGGSGQHPNALTGTPFGNAPNPGNAFDGDVDTYYVSVRPYPNPPYLLDPAHGHIGLDLGPGNYYRLTNARVMPRYVTGQPWVADRARGWIQGSVDGITFVPLGEIPGGNEPGWREWIGNAEELANRNQLFRYFRLHGTPWFDLTVAEVEFFGYVPQPCIDCGYYPCECPEPPTPCDECGIFPCICTCVTDTPPGTFGALVYNNEFTVAPTGSFIFGHGSATRMPYNSYFLHLPDTGGAGVSGVHYSADTVLVPGNLYVLSITYRTDARPSGRTIGLGAAPDEWQHWFDGVPGWAWDSIQVPISESWITAYMVFTAGSPTTWSPAIFLGRQYRGLGHGTWDVLSITIHELDIEAADKTNLALAIAAAEAITDQELFIPATWVALQTALMSARAVYNNVLAEQPAVDAATTALQNAINGMVLRTADAFRVMLGNLIAEAQGLNEGSYTPATWTILESALAAAQTVYADSSADIPALRAQLAALQAAINGLVPQQAAILLPNGDFSQGLAGWNGPTWAATVAPNSGQNALNTSDNMATVNSGWNRFVSDVIIINEPGWYSLSAWGMSPGTTRDIHLFLTYEYHDGAMDRDRNWRWTADGTPYYWGISDLGGPEGSRVVPSVVDFTGIDSWMQLGTVFELTEELITAYNGRFRVAFRTEANDGELAITGINLVLVCDVCRNDPCLCGVVINRDALALVIAAAEVITEEFLFTPATWAALQEALATARAVYSNQFVLQDVIDHATATLQDALDALIARTIAELQDLLGALIADALGHTQADYRPGTWTPFAAALATAQAVHTNAAATEMMIANAFTALMQARAELVALPPELTIGENLFDDGFSRHTSPSLDGWIGAYRAPAGPQPIDHPDKVAYHYIQMTTDWSVMRKPVSLQGNVRYRLSVWVRGGGENPAGVVLGPALGIPMPGPCGPTLCHDFWCGCDAHRTAIIRVDNVPDWQFRTIEFVLDADLDGEIMLRSWPGTPLQVSDIRIEVLEVFDTYGITFGVIGTGGTLTAAVGQTAILHGSTVRPGTSVTFTANPAIGFTVDRWEVNGVPATADRTLTTTITADTDVRVSFVPAQGVILTHGVQGGTGEVVARANGRTGITSGTVVPNGSGVSEGFSLAFMATPADGYEVSHWIVNGAPVQFVGRLFTIPYLHGVGAAGALTFDVQVAFQPADITGGRFDLNSSRNTTYRGQLGININRDASAIVSGSGLNSVFSDAFMASMAPFGLIRFMNYTNTNNHFTIHDWNAAEATLWGEVIALSNATNADIWICIPANASDAYIRTLAELMQANLNPYINVYVEWGNEIWGFENQRNVNRRMAQERGIPTDSRNIWAAHQLWWEWTDYFHFAQRTAEIAFIFRDVFNEDDRDIDHDSRVRPVLTWQVIPNAFAPMIEWLDGTTHTPFHSDPKFRNPHTYLWAVGIAPYFSEPQVALANCIDVIHRHMLNSIEAQQNTLQAIIDNAAAAGLLGGAVTYEGGPHYNAGGMDGSTNLVIRTAAQDHPLMIDLMNYYIMNFWFGLGGSWYTHYRHLGGAAPWGHWGVKNDLSLEQFKNATKYASLQWISRQPRGTTVSRPNVPPPPPFESPIRNPSFEYLNPQAHWNLGLGWSIDRYEAADGENALRFDGSVSTPGGWFEVNTPEFTLEQHTDYVFSFWHKGEAGFKVIVGGATGEFYAITEYSDVWVEYLVPFYTGTGALFNVKIGHEWNANPETNPEPGRLWDGDAWFDFFFIDENLIYNPSFERGMDGWGHGLGWIGTQDFARTNTQAFHQNHSLRIFGEITPDGLISNQFTLRANMDYRFIFYSMGCGNLNVPINIADVDVSLTTQPNTNWTRYETRFTSAGMETLTGNLRPSTVGPVTAAYIDNFMLFIGRVPVPACHVVAPVFSLHAFNNGAINNQSLANGGTIRIWTRLDGANALVPFAGLNVTAAFSNGESAMHLVNVNRPWNNQNYVNFIDVNMHAPWQRIYLTATLHGQVVELVLVNPRFFSLQAFNNGTINNQSLANSGVIRIWTQLMGVNALVPNSLVVTAVDQDNNNAMHLVRVNEPWANPGFVNLIDVNFDAPWRRIYFTATVFGQTVELVLINPRPPVVPEFSLNVFNNGVINNQSLANAGLIRLWTRLDGVNANVLIMEITAVDQDGNDAMVHLRRINTVGVSPQNGFDVNFNAPWQRIYLTVTAYGQTLELTLVNPS